MSDSIAEKEIHIVEASDQNISKIEKDIISYALRLSGGDQRIASFILGVKPSLLNEKIEKFKLKNSNEKERGTEPEMST